MGRRAVSADIEAFVPAETEARHTLSPMSEITVPRISLVTSMQPAGIFNRFALDMNSSPPGNIPYLRLDLPTCSGVTAAGVATLKRGAPARMASVMKLGAK